MIVALFLLYFFLAFSNVDSASLYLLVSFNFPAARYKSVPKSCNLFNLVPVTENNNLLFFFLFTYTC